MNKKKNKETASKKDSLNSLHYQIKHLLKQPSLIINQLSFTLNFRITYVLFDIIRLIQLALYAV